MSRTWWIYKTCKKVVRSNKIRHFYYGQKLYFLRYVKMGTTVIRVFVIILKDDDNEDFLVNNEEKM